MIRPVCIAGDAPSDDGASLSIPTKKSKSREHLLAFSLFLLFFVAEWTISSVG